MLRIARPEPCIRPPNARGGALFIRPFAGLGAGWQHVARYDIPAGLPSMDPPMGRFRRPVRLSEQRFVAGDWRDSASIQGALVSGRRAATAVLKELGA